MESPNNTTKYRMALLCNNKLCRRKQLFIIVQCLVVVVLLSTQTQINKFKIYNFEWFGQVLKQTEELFQPTCVNVLDRAVVGHWVGREVTQQEVEELNNFYKMNFQMEGASPTFQRADGRCGNVALGGAGNKGIAQFRALCDPNGTLPCCFEYKCVSKPVEHCRCEHCYDLRQQIHAELSTWIPADPTCKIMEFKDKQDLCRLLKDVTIYFIGDSFIRQIYISLISLVRDSPFHVNATAEQKKMCDKHLIMTSHCKSVFTLDTNECGNKTRLRYMPHIKVHQTRKIVEHVAELQGQPNTFVIFCSGIHFGFRVNVVENQIMKPILSQLTKSPWPVPIWLSTHSVGLLKPLIYKSQKQDYVVKYNLKINDIFRRNRIPIMDFYQMTNNVMSYDGTHYGSGINQLKTQIILNYILELRTNATNV